MTKCENIGKFPWKGSSEYYFITRESYTHFHDWVSKEGNFKIFTEYYLKSKTRFGERNIEFARKLMGIGCPKASIHELSKSMGISVTYLKHIFDVIFNHFYLGYDFRRRNGILEYD